jgi:hypothetical protein
MVPAIATTEHPRKEMLGPMLAAEDPHVYEH